MFANISLNVEECQRALGFSCHPVWVVDAKHKRRTRSSAQTTLRAASGPQHVTNKKLTKPSFNDCCSFPHELQFIFCTHKTNCCMESKPHMQHCLAGELNGRKNARYISPIHKVYRADTRLPQPFHPPTIRSIGTSSSRVYINFFPQAARTFSRLLPQ